MCACPSAKAGTQYSLSEVVALPSSTGYWMPAFEPVNLCVAIPRLRGGRLFETPAARAPLFVVACENIAHPLPSW